MEPLVSVCVPTYNGAKYLSKCLDSILAQTLANLEILIVDDQSSDETVQIIQKYQSYDSRIRLIINQKNLGLVGNWNRCVELSKGEWIKFVFQDDVIQANCLEQMVAAVKPNTSIISCRRSFLFENDIPLSLKTSYNKIPLLEELFPKKTEISAIDYCQAVINHRNRIYLNFVGEPTSVMLHRSVFHRFGHFNPNLVQMCDLEYWTRVATHSGLTYIPETLAIFRVHGNSTSNANQQNRDYRTNILDQLIIVHDFVYHPIYAPLRNVANQQEPSVNLELLLAGMAYNARRIAERATSNPNVQDPSLLQEWERITKLYPILLKVSQRSLFKRIIKHGMYRLKLLKQSNKIKK